MSDERLREAYAASVVRRPESRAGCPDPERLRAVAELAGSEAERIATLDHVMTCAACKEEYDLLAAVAAEGPSARRAASGVQWRRLAVAAVVLLAVGGGLYWSLQGPGGEPIRGGPRSLLTIAPVGEVAIPPNVRLVWNAVADVVGYRAEVLDAGGAVVYAGSTSDTTMALPDSVMLATNTAYRWWVSAELPDGTVLRSALVDFRVRP